MKIEAGNQISEKRWGGERNIGEAGVKIEGIKILVKISQKLKIEFKYFYLIFFIWEIFLSITLFTVTFI